LNVNNIDEAIIKIKKLISYKKFFQQIEKIYSNYNNNNNNQNDNLNNILIWIFDICKFYSENDYKSYFNNIMTNYNIKDFEQLKLLVNNFIFK